MISAVAVLWAVHERSIMLLYTFTEPAQITTFQAITLATLTAIAAVVTAYMGIQGFAKSTLTQIVSTAATSEFSHHVEETIEHVVEEGKPGAPARRPWTAHAVEGEE